MAMASEARIFRALLRNHFSPFVRKVFATLKSGKPTSQIGTKRQSLIKLSASAGAIPSASSSTCRRGRLNR